MIINQQIIIEICITDLIGLLKLNNYKFKTIRNRRKELRKRKGRL